MLDRKSQILDAAAELLQSRSFSSFSYKDLSVRLGITKASIHHHFASKEALGVALLDRYLSEAKANLETLSRKYDTPWDRFEGYVALMSKIMQSGNKICAPGILQAEYNVIPEGMQEGARRLYGLIVKWLASVLAAGREQNLMKFHGEPEDQASLIHAALQGALQNARADGPAKFTAVVRQLRESMRTHG